MDQAATSRLLIGRRWPRQPTTGHQPEVGLPALSVNGSAGVTSNASSIAPEGWKEHNTIGNLYCHRLARAESRGQSRPVGITKVEPHGDIVRLTFSTTRRRANVEHCIGQKFPVTAREELNADSGWPRRKVDARSPDRHVWWSYGLPECPDRHETAPARFGAGAKCRLTRLPCWNDWSVRWRRLRRVWHWQNRAESVGRHLASQLRDVEGSTTSTSERTWTGSDGNGTALDLTTAPHTTKSGRRSTPIPDCLPGDTRFRCRATPDELEETIWSNRRQRAAVTAGFYHRAFQYQLTRNLGDRFRSRLCALRHRPTDSRLFGGGARASCCNLNPAKLTVPPDP
jgi:hypothetical protein